MRSPNPSVYILLPVYNRKNITLKFVDCLIEQNLENFHLVLLDDGSTDGTGAAVASKLEERVTVLTGSGDWWWAGALQAGLDWLKAQQVLDDATVLFINDDLEIRPDFLSVGIEELREEPNVMLLARQVDQVTGAVEGTGGGLMFDAMRMRFAPARTDQEVECLPTRGLFCRFGDVKAVGEFVPTRLRHYFSDYEFTIRARRKGMMLKVSKKISIFYTLDTTGAVDADLYNKSIIERIHLSLTNRFHGNPLYYTRFARLVTPTFQLPVALVWIWGNWILKIVGVR